MKIIGATILLSSLLATGCVGSRTYVSANSAKYPVSMSSAVRGPDGVVLGPGQLENKGEISIDYLTCRLLWTLIPLKPLTGNRDISDEINSVVAARGGEAVTNLKVTSGTTVWGVFTLLGVLPDCGKVKIRGDVVARRVVAPPPAPPPPPAPAPAPAPPPEPTPAPTPPAEPGS